MGVSDAPDTPMMGESSGVHDIPMLILLLEKNVCIWLER